MEKELIAIPDGLPDCTICHQLWRRFMYSSTILEIRIGSFEEAAASNCPGHMPLVQHFRDWCDGKTDELKDMGILGGSSSHSVALVESISTHLGYFWELLLVKKHGIRSHPGTGRILDPNWADLEMVRHWKNECLSSHDVRCDNPLRVWRTRPAWLVDVENMMVVPGHNSDSSYVALSYRWGEGVRLKADAATLRKVRAPNSLNNPEIFRRLPPIIRHAMYFTSEIGERYLWIDMLCIDPSDVKVMHEQLNFMGAIYANALITIIAADGDAMDGLNGLKGLRGSSSARNLEQISIPFGGETIIVRNANSMELNHGNGSSPYYERGWTYQESALSCKKIFFLKGELHWMCRCNIWHEEHILDAQIDTYINPRLTDIMAGFPDLGCLSHTIGEYNERELTYEEDALPGISGLLSVFSRSFTGGFLYGLPEMMFDRALGWRPIWGHVNLLRRKASSRPQDNHLGPSSLPSWSWIGWQGLVTMDYGEAGRVNPRETCIEETIPITEWFTMSSTDGPKRRIRSTWFENRDSYKDFSRPLPPGWTRHELAPTSDWLRGARKEESRLYPDGCGEYVFTHINMPASDEDVGEWFYPFPVPDISESTPAFTPEQTPYLFCETQTAHLWAHQDEDRGEDVIHDSEIGQNVLILCNKNRKAIGSLHLHNDDQLDLFPETVAEGCLGEPVELAAIYLSRRYSKTFDRKTERYTSPVKIGDSYKVLWVKWQDGVAYRQAVGNVAKEEWESLELRDVSLVLG